MASFLSIGLISMDDWNDFNSAVDKIIYLVIFQYKHIMVPISQKVSLFVIKDSSVLTQKYPKLENVQIEKLLHIKKDCTFVIMTPKCKYKKNTVITSEIHFKICVLLYMDVCLNDIEVLYRSLDIGNTSTVPVHDTKDGVSFYIICCSGIIINNILLQKQTT